MSEFYPVTTSRDYIKHNGKKLYMWEFMDYKPHGFLTSIGKQINTFIPKEFHVIYDCGAWSYRNMETPPISAETVCRDYAKVAKDGDVVTAPDHMIINESHEKERGQFNLAEAERFFAITKRTPYIPMAVVHGLTISKKIDHAQHLFDIGYRYLAIGGLAARARDIHYVVDSVVAIRERFDCMIHALGVSSPFYANIWDKIGVTSFDGSSYFVKALTKGTYLDEFMNPYQIRDGGDNIPPCDCKACEFVKSVGGDTRTAGNSTNNIGRAIHNLNMLMRNTQ